MDDPISIFMKKTVRTAAPDDKADMVEELLHQHSLSAVPVVNASGRIFGIISTADLQHLHKAKVNLKALHAWELCANHPVSAQLNTSVSEVAQLMTRHQVHHIPITENGKLCGMVSALDLVEKFT